MILFDLTALQSQKNAPSHGGGKFAEVVFYRMLERNITFSVFYDSSRHIKPEIIELVQNKSIEIYDINEISIDQIVHKESNPLIFSILPQSRYFICKTIGTIHDCREICAPTDIKMFYLEFNFKDIIIYIAKKIFPHIMKRRVINNMKKIYKHPNFIPTTITRFTKYTLCDVLEDSSFLNIPIFSTPSYYKPFKDLNLLENNKYILMVSANRAIKNPVRAIAAIDKLFDHEQMKCYKFVVVGMSEKDKAKIKINNNQNFVFKDYVSENELTELYKNCTCLLFPSLYEGFGMPPLEAMCYGKPVVASSLSAIPEICGDGAIYIDPFSEDDIKCKMLSLLLDEEYYIECSSKAKSRFSEMYKKQSKDLDEYIDFVVSYNNRI